MLALTRHCLRAVLYSMALVLLLAVGAATVRLLPWLLSPDVPLAVALPFAKALLVVALEAALLVGVPTGFALGTALLVERGEARALHCAGVSPLGFSVRAMGLLSVLSLAAFAAMSAAQGSTDKPGRFAQALIEQARRSCDSNPAKSVPVPIVGLTWLCFERAPPRVTGPVPNSGGRAWFSASAISVDEDLTTFYAQDLFVGAPASATGFRVRLRVKLANIAGLPAWGRSSPLENHQRSLVVAMSLAVLGILAVFVVSRLACANFALAGGAAGLAGIATLRVLHSHTLEIAPERAAAEVLAVGIAVSLAPLVFMPVLRLALRKWPLTSLNS